MRPSRRSSIALNTKYEPKNCEVCGEIFTPLSGRAKKCEACRLIKTKKADDVLKDYEADVIRTENKSLQNPLIYGAMKLAEEAGEACGIVAKHIGQGHDLPLDKLHEELGDVLYFVTYIAEKTGVNLTEIMRINTKKRKKRYPNGFEESRSVNR